MFKMFFCTLLMKSQFSFLHQRLQDNVRKRAKEIFNLRTVNEKKYMAKEHGEALDVMRAVKLALDPHNLMNPGKILPQS